MATNDGKQQRDWGPALRTITRLLVVALLVWLTHLAISWIMKEVGDLENAAGLRIGMLGLLLLIYILLMAVPFVPGVEIGISLMVLEGGAVAPFVYIATVMGLLLAYCIGRNVNYAVIKRVVTDLRLIRTGDLIEKIAPLSQKKRLRLLHKLLPDRIAPFVVRHRCLVLAVLLNVPGNAIIGGGGGLALVAGFSRLYSMRESVLTFAIAVSPVPLMVYFLDFQPLG